MGNKVKITTKHSSIRECEIQLTGLDIVSMLAERGVSMGSNPNAVEVTFNIPGGGDWSNKIIDVNKEYPITVSWKIEEDSSVDTTYG